MSHEREQALHSALAGAEPPKDANQNLAQAAATLANQSAEHSKAKDECHSSLTRWRVFALLAVAGWGFSWWRTRR
jgi:hypothetical protein